MTSDSISICGDARAGCGAALSRPKRAPRNSLVACGFRPFFLAAGLTATVLVPWWAASYALGFPLGTAWPPTLWHGHEMLFGFIGAATLVRVFGLAWLHSSYPIAILFAAFLGTTAFALFAWIYLPILLRPRVDGKPG